MSTSEQWVAVDGEGHVIGVYAVDPADPQLPGVPHEKLIPAPMKALPSVSSRGVPILSWVEAGWRCLSHEGTEVFVSPQPFSSWTLDANYEWQPPTPMPTEGGPWTWDEETLSWVELPPLS